MKTLVASDEPERPDESGWITMSNNTSSGILHQFVGVVRMEDVPEGPTQREPFRTQAYVDKSREIEP